MSDHLQTESWEYCLCRSCALFRDDMLTIASVAAVFTDTPELLMLPMLRQLQNWYIEGKLVLPYIAMNLKQ